MEQNLSPGERVGRTALAILFLALRFGRPVTGWGGLVLLLAALYGFLTAALGYCPLYAALGWSTRRV